MRFPLLLIVLSACSRTPEPAPAPSVRAAATVLVPGAAVPLASGGGVESRHDPACPADPGVGWRLPTAFIDLGGVRLNVELARSSEETERGLMYRTHMDENNGMLFRLGRREEHTFWMHNTCIPLDMLFIDNDGAIVGILEDVPTLNDDPRTVGLPSTHVLEVNAGWCRRHGVKTGQKLLLPALAK